MSAYRIASDLEVIKRTGEHADPKAVSQLLAQGLRNAVIAQRLVVTPKTIDHHVSSILRKLGVTNRGQAGAAAAQLGMIAPEADHDPTLK